MPACKPARATRWQAVALENIARIQINTNLTMSVQDSACIIRPITMSPNPRLSALVRAWRRVYTSGKRNKPTVPAKKKKAPKSVRPYDSHALTMASFLLGTLRPLPGPTDERHRGHGRQQDQNQGHIIQGGPQGWGE